MIYILKCINTYNINKIILVINIINMVKGIIKNIRKKYNIISDKRYQTISGSISFFFILSIIPFLFIMSLILNFLNININIESNIIPENIISILKYVFNIQRDNITSYSIFLVIIALYTSSKILFQITECGEIIYKKKKEKFIKKRIITILEVFILMIVLVSIIILNIIGNKYLYKIVDGLFIIVFKYFLSVLFPLLLIYILNIFVSPIKLNFKDLYKGVLFTFIYWFISTILFNIYYMYFSNLEVFYGALSLIIVSLLYIYILSIGLVIGFIINYHIKYNTGNNINGDTNEKNN